MNYIGSKQKLAPWILSVIKENCGENLSHYIFADIFAGTGQVARLLKKEVKQVITNDLENYSFILNSHYIGNSSPLKDFSIENIISDGFFYNYLSPKSNLKRMYFTEENSKKIDGIRLELERLLEKEVISKEQYFWGLASLIEATDSVANTASIYGAFLKDFKKTALKSLNFKLVNYEVTNQKNKVFQKDANILVKEISGDILYLDPPYNHRQYGANYHVLNKLVSYKEQDFISDKITCLTDYNKSNYCKKDKVFNEFKDLIKNANFKYIFISYNNEGLIKEQDFQEMLKEFGTYKLYEKEYKRFKADAKRPNQSPNTFEHLHVLIKK